MAGSLILTQEDATVFGMRSDAPNGKYQLELSAEYEAGFLTVDQLTSEEVTEFEGVKICFKIFRGEAALGGWYPLRARKPTGDLCYLLREVMATLRLFGLVSEKETTD